MQATQIDAYQGSSLLVLGTTMQLGYGPEQTLCIARARCAGCPQYGWIMTKQTNPKTHRIAYTSHLTKTLILQYNKYQRWIIQMQSPFASKRDVYLSRVILECPKGPQMVAMRTPPECTARAPRL